MADTTISVAGHRAGSASPVRKQVGAWIKLAVIALAGALGVLAAVITVLPLFGWNTVVLASGSMAPAYPAGSVLLVRDVPVTQVEVGDIVTVQRPGGSPITHRVVSIEESIAGAALLRLQGDANDTADAQPYAVERVGLVAGGIPWGGHVLTGIRSPWGLAALTIAVAALLLWSWWPKEPNTKDQSKPELDTRAQGVSTDANNS